MQEWTGKIVLGDDWAIFVGAGGRTPMHRHLAHKIVMGLDRPIRVVDENGQERAGKILQVLPGAMHQVVASGARVALYYADAGAFPDVSCPALKEAAALVELCKRLDRGDETILGSLEEMLKPEDTQPADERVARAVGQMRNPASAKLDAIAFSVGLSQSRFRQVFGSAVGGAPARYRRWLRLRMAAEYLGRGERIADAALEAGFSDAAHLNRTFIEMLGITPGMFQASEVIVLPSAHSPP